jgi:hypothetical protein
VTLERRSQSQKSRSRRGRRNGKTRGDQNDQGKIAEVTEENEPKVMEILEFSCSYGEISHEKNSYERIDEGRKGKDAELATELKNLRREQV